MRKRPLFLVGVLALLVSLLPLGGLTRAQEPSPGPNLSLDQYELDPQTELLVNKQLAAMKGPSKIVIELADQATTQTFASAQASGASAAQATAQAQRQLATVNAAQQTLQSQLTAPAVGAQVIYRTQRVFNAIAVEVDSSKFAQIKALRGVKAIYPLVAKERDNASSVPFIGTPEVWEQYGIAGDGITIGIIDTGIDYLHTNFGGPGTQAAYDANNDTVIGDSPYFPSAKVAGGFDFVGDDYNANDPESVPVPDPDPIDCAVAEGGGHGTHVAGTAGGYGVNADGTTYTGPYTTDTNFDALRIGPGVAAKAQLYALRVFGCEGSTNVTELAIEYSVDPNGDGDFSDRLDVINMSLGSDYGSPVDSTAIASDNAASVGVIVVASAGNSGDTYYITGSPGSSSRTISVASSVDSTDVVDGFRVNAPAAIAGVKPSSNSVAYDFTTQPDVTADVVYPPTQRTGCTPFDAANAAAIAGKIALLDWVDTGPACPPGSAGRTNNAADAGAVGVIFVYPEPVIEISIAGSDRIPATITTAPVGDQIKAQLAAGATVNATLTDEFNGTQKIVLPERNDTLSDFSSRGPRRNDSVLKPDIAAPGQTITSARAGTGTEPYTISGTSMAAPHIAGTMALLRQLHPDWSVAELKALAMNTATNDLRTEAAENSPVYGPGRIGAGRVDVPNAAASEVVAYNAENPELVSVSFGNVEVVDTTSIIKTIRVLNKSDETQTYEVDFRPLVQIPGVRYSLSVPSVTLQPFGSANIQVRLTATASEMQHTRDQTVEDTQAGLPRHWLSEAAGYVVLTGESEQPTLRVPVHALARPASRMEAVTGTLPAPGSTATTGEIPLRGLDVETGENLPLDEVSIATAFELQISDPNEANTQGFANNADLKYVGVSTNLRTTESGAVEDSTLYFGIATQDDWTTPTEVGVEVVIDTNQDGTDDFVVGNTAVAVGGDGTDVFVSYLLDLETGDAVLLDFLNGVPASALNTVPFNTNVMVLPVPAADLGLTSQNSAFSYRVRSTSFDVGEDDEGLGSDSPDEGFADNTTTQTYDAARPGIDLSNPELAGLPAHFDLDGNSIPFVYDRAAFAANQSQGVLILHHHNARGDRDEVIRQQGQSKLYLPLIIDNDGDFNN